MSRVTARRLAAGALLCALIAAVAAALLVRSDPGETSGTVLAASPPLREHGREVAVYFSRHPESDDEFSAVFPVGRLAPDAGVARAALQALIDGATPAEADAGYYSELGTMLVGPSTCGADFAVRVESGLATVRFCRGVSSAGIGQDARVQSAINATLRQFSTVQRVRILDADGNCLFDMSGENRCLREP
jgi:hypothetical protein